jgi:hypothetical protein
VARGSWRYQNYGSPLLGDEPIRLQIFIFDMNRVFFALADSSRYKSAVIAHFTIVFRAVPPHLDCGMSLFPDIAEAAQNTGRGGR